MICLDDTEPYTRDEVGRALWHGDGRNRFFDKTLQFIVFKNGKAGFNGEHSMVCCIFIGFHDFRWMQHQLSACASMSVKIH